MGYTNRGEGSDVVDDKVVYNSARRVVDVGLENFYRHGSGTDEYAFHRVRLPIMGGPVCYCVGGDVCSEEDLEGEDELYDVDLYDVEGKEGSYRQMIKTLNNRFMVEEPSTKELETFAKKLMVCWMDDTVASRNGTD